MNKVRKSNFELLRIIAMVMIIAHHVCVHGYCVFDSGSISSSDLWLQFLKMWGKVGVNIYVLISGYFLVKSNKFNIVKLVKLWLHIAFYSVGIYMGLVLCTSMKFGKLNFIKSAMPILFEQWWFASTYVMLYILVPFINRIIRRIDKKKYQQVLIVMTMCWCIIPTFTSKFFQANDLVWFIYLYFLAGYIRLWLDDVKWNVKACMIATFVVVAVTYLATVAFYIIGLREYATSFYTMQHLPILLIALLLFLGFKNMDIKNSSFINTVAASTFGIYLIHDNTHLRPVIWIKIFNLYRLHWKKWFIPYTILAIIIVFVVCCIIELIRKKLCNILCKKISLEFKNRIYIKVINAVYKVKDWSVNLVKKVVKLLAVRNTYK